MSNPVLPANIIDRILAPRPEDIESKLWNRHFFYPGRSLQDSELNEMETLIFNVIDRLGRTLFREGSIIAGVEVIQKPGNLVQVTSGTMYIDGRSRDITGTQQGVDLQLLGTGSEYVGIVRSEIIRRPETSPELLDPQIAPTVGADQFNLKGALRQIYQYDWVVVNTQNPNPSAIPIFEFRDGNLITSQSQGQYTTLLQVLNRRTYDSFGHFLVNGFQISIAQDPNDVDKLLVRIDPGKAYVSGAEIQKNAPSIFTLEKAITANFVPGEDFRFLTTPQPKRIYKLASNPVKDVTLVAAKVRRSWADGNGVRVVRSTSDSFDDLFSDTLVTPNIGPNGAQKGIAVYQVLKISNTQNGASNYTQGLDWDQSGNTIVWKTGNRPGPGQTYYVDLVLIRDLTAGRRVRTVVTNEQVFHNANNGIDTLARKDLIRVTRVAAGPNPGDQVYLEGRDFIVNSGRTGTTHNFPTLDWSNTGAGVIEMSAGTPYVVSYEYWDHPVGFEGDYVSYDDYFDTDGVTPAGSFLKTYKFNSWDTDIENSVDFRVIGGDTPMDQSDVNVQYNFYVPRRDTISLDSSGEFVIHKGVPGRNPTYPPVAISTLQVAKLDIPANSTNVLVIYPETRRLTVPDLWQLREMIDVQVYNAAIRYLESLAMFEFTASMKKMVLVDPFIDFSRANFLSAGATPFKASVDPENGAVMLPQVFGSRKLNVLSLTGIARDPNNVNRSKFRSVAMATYTEENLISQPFATESTVLNPYNNLGPVVSIRISPDQNFWCDPSSTPDVRLDARSDSLIPVTQDDLRLDSNRLTRVFGFVRKAFNRFWVGGTQRVPWGGTGQLNQITSIYYPTAVLQDYRSDQIVVSRAMDRVDDRILDRSVTPVMDQQTVTVTSDNWLALADNIAVYFDGVQMMCTGTAPGYVGSVAGTLRSDAQGYFSGTFVIPAKSRTGRKEVRAVSLIPGSASEYAQATAIYAAEGLRQIHNTSYISIDVAGTSNSSGVDIVNPVTRAEPIAQEIIANRDVPITGVNIYFKTRPSPGSSTDRPVFVQIRDLDENGQPTSNILAQKVLRASNVTPSLDASEKTVVTFDDPVFIEANQHYAIVITTDSPEYAVFLSRLGSRDYLTQQLVVQNPQTGTLWRSEGGVEYTPDPYATLKFDVRCAVFAQSTSSTIVFQNITNLSSNQLLREVNGDTNYPRVPGQQGLLPNKYSKFLHVVSQYTPPGARIIWSYSINGGVTWIPYTPGVEVSMGGAQTQLQVKCDMDMQQVTGTLGGSITPSSSVVNLLHNGLVLIGQEDTGNYITYSTNLASPANNVRLLLVTDLPLANASPLARLKVSYSTDGGFTWSSLDSAITPTERLLTSPWYERVYDGVIPQYTKLAIRLDLFNDINLSSDPQARVLRVISY